MTPVPRQAGPASTRERAGRRRPRVLIVGRAAPAQSGISTFVETLLADDGLRDAYELTLLNTTRQAERRSGTVSGRNVVDALTDAARTFRRARRADVVHLQTALWPAPAMVRALATCAAGRLAGAGVLCHVHAGVIAEAPTFGRGARLLLRTLALVDAVLTVSEPGTEALRRVVPRARVVTVDNAIDVHAFEPAPLDGDCPRLLYVGALSRKKGVIDLVAALELLREREPDGWDLQLVGGAAEVGDAEAEEIRSVVRAAGWGDALAGVHHGAALRERFRTADVFVLPSHEEGQPMTILEAMAAGLPVVATRVGAVPDMIREGVEGTLVDAHDVPALAAALGELVRSGHLRRRMGSAARARAEERYDGTRLRQQLAEEYARAVPRRRRVLSG